MNFSEVQKMASGVMAPAAAPAPTTTKSPKNNSMVTAVVITIITLVLVYVLGKMKKYDLKMKQIEQQSKQNVTEDEVECIIQHHVGRNAVCTRQQETGKTDNKSVADTIECILDDIEEEETDEIDETNKNYVTVAAGEVILQNQTQSPHVPEDEDV